MARVAGCGSVVAADSSALAPALLHADFAERTPLLSAPDYVPALLDMVERRSISLLVPTIDTELPVLAEHRAALAARGCVALVSSRELVAMAMDKARTQRFMEDRGIRVPRGWTLDRLATSELPDELFVKPRHGSSSMHCHATTRDELHTILPLVPDPLVQERLTGPEITIDALLSLEGETLHFVPRERLRTLGGESIQGVTLDDTAIRDWVRTVLGALSELGAVGPLTLQAFLTNDGPVLIEVNPRFGGGFPLTNEAGGHYPAWVVDMALGWTVQSAIGIYTRGLYMTRFFDESFTTTLPW